MSHPEIGVVVQARHPPRRVHHPVLEARAQAPVGLRDVAHDARIARSAGPVAGDADAHAGQLEARREAHRADRRVAPLARDVGMPCVCEMKVGNRHLDARDTHRRGGGPALVAEVAAAPRGQRDRRRVRTIDGVAAGTRRLARQQVVAAVGARRARRVAARTGHARNRQVSRVREAQRQALRRKDQVRRALVGIRGGLRARPRGDREHDREGEPRQPCAHEVHGMFLS